MDLTQSTTSSVAEAAPSVHQTEWFILILAVVSVVLSLGMYICYKQLKHRLFTFETPAGNATSPQNSTLPGELGGVPNRPGDPPSYWDLPDADVVSQKSSTIQRSAEIQLEETDLPGSTVCPPAYQEAVGGANGASKFAPK